MNLRRVGSIALLWIGLWGLPPGSPAQESPYLSAIDRLVRVIHKGKNIRLVVGTDYLFGPSQRLLRVEAYPFLRRLAHWLNATAPLPIVLDIPQDDWQLFRYADLYDFLTTQGHIPPNRFLNVPPSIAEACRVGLLPAMLADLAVSTPSARSNPTKKRQIVIELLGGHVLRGVPRSREIAARTQPEGGNHVARR